MKLSKRQAEIFVPDAMDPEAALARVTHVGIGAHQDDLEILAIHGILESFGRDDAWFAGITCTDGAGSPRAGVYAARTDEEMKRIRRGEQRTAACLGGYGAMAQLDFTSAEAKGPGRAALAGDLAALVGATRAHTVYTHSPADKHDTHVAVLLAALQALRALPPARRPRRFYGCEVWRDLDWLPDPRKVALPLAGHENLEAALLGAFDSQIAGGKRYDLATLGRRRANATYFQSHSVDAAERLVFAMDLSPLLADAAPEAAAFTETLLEEFRGDVLDRIRRLQKP
jgi:LmbE family N-acetylglucosaminyl deacetylase